ncbi:unnamed protein product, partial [Discosporangium mesarthrocarpum]
VRILVTLAILLVVLAAAGAWILSRAGQGAYGELVAAGDPTREALAPSSVEARETAQARTAADLRVHEPKQILFGDLHVHSSFSIDAFQLTLPMTGGEGTHPVADACDFARFCSNLDFWSINDHAASLTPRRWQETVETIRRCDAIGDGSGERDLVSFLGWEWTQMGSTPDNHYGHKNVVLRDLEDDSIPARPIAARPPDGVPSPFDVNRGGTVRQGLGAFAIEGGHDLIAMMRELMSADRCPDGVPVRELPADCMESVQTPGALFEKLDQWGHAATVIPHGTVWGMYSPPGSGWAKQLSPEQHDPDRQRLIEIYSGHGNAEEYRPWKAVEIAADGSRRCPAPSPDYTPTCWQAGEVIRARCEAEGADADECDDRAVEARQFFVDADRNAGAWVVPGLAAHELLDAGQCRDCFQPAFNHRPRSSAQAILALGRPEAEEGARSFRFGFIASSDNHTARAGTGYKEVERLAFTDARMGRAGSGLLVDPWRREPAARAERFDPMGPVPNVAFFEGERGGSFFYTGGLAAVHAPRRERGEIFDALERRETYGTSGPRILLWFDLLDPNAPGGRWPMGSEVAIQGAPTFRVRAAGSFEQKPGCPDATTATLTPERLERLCRGECYHPSETRRPITRIEVVRIRTQHGADEPMESLIDDPWQRFECSDDREGCEVVFSDPEFARDARNTSYYVRAIEAASPTIAADPYGCRDAGPEGCTQLDPCFSREDDDDCKAPDEHRAWSSPIFVSPSPG